MATVYLAQDLKHHRQVALKVLRAELAASLGPGRFLHETDDPSRLGHFFSERPLYKSTNYKTNQVAIGPGSARFGRFLELPLYKKAQPQHDQAI